MTEARSDPLDVETSVSEHLRRAARGDEPSWLWLIERFSPLLVLQARYRLSGALTRLFDVDDLVDDVWLVVLRRLPDMSWPEQAAAPAFARFLSTTLLHRIHDAARKHVQRDGLAKDLALREPNALSEAVEQRSAESTSVLSRLARSEVRRLIALQLSQLDPDEQELLTLRGLEGLPAAELARRWNLPESTVTRRYRHVLAKLRFVLPRSMLDEFERS